MGIADFFARIFLSHRPSHMINFAVLHSSKVQFQLVQFTELYDPRHWKMSCNSTFQATKHVNAWISQSLWSYHEGEHKLYITHWASFHPTKAKSWCPKPANSLRFSQVLFVKLLPMIQMSQKIVQSWGTGQRPKVLHSDKERFAKRPPWANTGQCQCICISVGTKLESVSICSLTTILTQLRILM